MFKLDFSNGDQGCCIQGTIWAQISGMQRLFDSLSDGRSYERCEGAGKSALRCEYELLYNQNCVREVGSQLFRAAGNTETASLTLFILPL